MSRTSKKMDKQIQKMIGQYVKETDPDKAKELMQTIRSMAEDQKTLDDIELRYQPIKKRNKIVELFKNKKEKDKAKVESEIMKEVFLEKMRNSDEISMEELEKLCEEETVVKTVEEKDES